jgi:hypothetical protein
MLGPESVQAVPFIFAPVRHKSYLDDLTGERVLYVLELIHSAMH